MGIQVFIRYSVSWFAKLSSNNVAVRQFNVPYSPIFALEYNLALITTTLDHRYYSPHVCWGIVRS